MDKFDLFFNAHVRGIHHKCILMPSQRGMRSFGIVTVPPDDLLFKLLYRRNSFASVFLQKLGMPSFRPFMRIRHKKNLELGIRKNLCSDITAIHDDTAIGTHLLLKPPERVPHLFQGTDETHFTADAVLPDLFRNVLPVKKNPVAPELNGKTSKKTRNPSRIQTETFKKPFTDSLERYRPVHGTGIDVRIPQLTGKNPCGGAFSGRGRAVDCNNDTLLSGTLVHSILT